MSGISTGHRKYNFQGTQLKILKGHKMWLISVADESTKTEPDVDPFILIYLYRLRVFSLL